MKKKRVATVLQLQLFETFPKCVYVHKRRRSGKADPSERSRLGPPVLTVPQTLAKSAGRGSGGLANSPPELCVSRLSVSPAYPKADDGLIERAYLPILRKHFPERYFELKFLQA